MEPVASPRSDAQLVATVAAGDTAALAELYDRHADAIFRAAFRRSGDRTIAEEVLQDTYLALWNRAETFDPVQGSLLAWLSTIARNRAIDRLRHQGRRPPAMPLSAVVSGDDPHGSGLDRAMAHGTLLGSGAVSVDPERMLEDAATRAEIRDALGAIPSRERQVLELAYYEGLTQVEIAQRLDWPLGTVKTRTRRALARLRETLTAVFGPEIAPPPRAERPGEGRDGPR
ncbi:MAG: sigma-70 family RNA polymerase sigma factor [Chloroflexota bacterium]|nr:sigma-70 family RNA polymerase sigma factor [Chloroflexota bacterium]